MMIVHIRKYAGAVDVFHHHIHLGEYLNNIFFNRIHMYLLW